MRSDVTKTSERSVLFDSAVVVWRRGAVCSADSVWTTVREEDI